MAKVLVTGATGFVGKRLLRKLLEDGHEIYALCRIDGATSFEDDKPNLHYIFHDLRNKIPLDLFPKDLDVAYYLVHSLSAIVNDLVKTEVDIAESFVASLKTTKVKQIIYLGGIVNDESALSAHLQSRLLVEAVLKKSSIPTTILRASIIIGAGSASFEIIRDLTEKLPFMIAPKWVNTPCQPIAIVDVLFYLSKVLLNEKCYGQIFDIGGPDILSFKELLLQYAAFRHLKRCIVNVPVLTPRLSSLWLVFITSVRFSICFYLVESIKTSSVCKLGSLQKIIPHSCLSYTKALELTFQNISQNDVVSTWMDSWDIEDITPSITKYIEVPKEGCLKDEREFEIKDSKDATISRIWSIGGSTGYYAMNWAWKLRGFLIR